MSSKNAATKSGLNQAWEGKYSEQLSEFVLLHKKFLVNLEVRKITQANFYHQLKECNSNYERITTVTNVLGWNSVKLTSRQVEKYQKEDNLASQFRKTANELYKSHKFTEAIRGYNLAICFASPGGKELPLAFANRSAVLLQSDRPLLSLHDIIRAQAHGYPDELLAKLVERKIKCLKLLNLDEAQLLDDNFFKEEFERSDYLPHEIRERRTFCNKLFTLRSPSPSIPSAEDYIRIHSSPDRGRHVITTIAVDPGTVLIVDEPFSKVLLHELRWDLDHCHHCHRRMCSGIPCPQCVFAFFCNAECLTRSNIQHQFECQCGPFLHLLQAPRTLTLTLRILCSVGPAELYRIFTTKDPNYSTPTGTSSSVLGFEEGVYNSLSYLSIYHLISHPDKYSGAELLSYSLTSILLVSILEKFTPFFKLQTSSPDEVEEFKTFVASLVLLHMQNLPCNAHSLNEISGIRDDTSPEDLAESIRTAVCTEYGAGAFALLSLINHSCDPNVFRLNLHSGRTAVVTIRPLSPGDEILDNYGEHYALDRIRDRKRQLSENYYFDCTCIACEYNWPLLPQLKVQPETFACGHCAAQKFSLVERLGPELMGKCTLNADSCNCKECGTKFDMTDLTETLNMKIDNFFTAHESLLLNEPLKALPELKNCITYFSNNVLPPFIRTNEAQETMKQALNLIVYSAR